MSMLAERRRKKKWVINPSRKPLWATNDSGRIKLGKELMEKMGWSPGKGLGLKEQGIQEPLKVSFKSDTKGLGFKLNDEEWIHHQDEFNSFLKELTNSIDPNSTDPGEIKKNQVKSLEEKSKQSRARVHYKKFTRGKDLSKYSENDLACILGTNKSKKDKKGEASEEEKNKKGEGKSEDGIESTFGVKTINGGSISDYFKRKSAIYVKKNDTGVTDTNEADSVVGNLKEVKKNQLVEDENFNEVEGCDNKKQKNKKEDMARESSDVRNSIKSKKRKNNNEFQVEEDNEEVDAGGEMKNKKRKKEGSIDVDEQPEENKNEENTSGDNNQPKGNAEKTTKKKKKKDYIFKERLHDEVECLKVQGVDRENRDKKQKKEKHTENFSKKNENLKEKEKKSKSKINEMFSFSVNELEVINEAKEKEVDKEELEESANGKKYQETKKSHRKKFKDEEKPDFPKKGHEIILKKVQLESRFSAEKSFEREESNQTVYGCFSEVNNSATVEKADEKKLKKKSEKVEDALEKNSYLKSSQEQVKCEKNTEKFREVKSNEEVNSKLGIKNRHEEEIKIKKIFEKPSADDMEESVNCSTKEKKLKKKKHKDEKKAKKKVEKDSLDEILEKNSKTSEVTEKQKIENKHLGIFKEGKSEIVNWKKDEKKESVGDEIIERVNLSEILVDSQLRKEESNNFKNKTKKQKKEKVIQEQIVENICESLEAEKVKEVKATKNKKSKKEKNKEEEIIKRIEKEESKVSKSQEIPERLKSEREKPQYFEGKKSKETKNHFEKENHVKKNLESSKPEKRTWTEVEEYNSENGQRKTKVKNEEDLGNELKSEPDFCGLIHSHKIELFRKKKKMHTNRVLKLICGAEFDKFKGSNVGLLPGYGVTNPSEDHLTVAAVPV